MEAVKAVNLTKRFSLSKLTRRKVTALENINFTIEEGEHLAVMGPSPSGKTTLLKLISGIYLPDEGDIYVYGYSIKKENEVVRRLTCYLSPQIQFNKKFTVREVLKYFTKVTGRKVDGEVKKLLKIAEITDETYNKRIEVLSDIQVAALKLSIGLIKKPKVLLLDEVFGSLEPKIKEAFINAVEKVSEESTLVMVDREMELLDKFCKKVLLLIKGRIAAMGSVRELLSGYPYKYDVEVIPKTVKSINKITEIEYPHQIFGNLIRFYLKNESEVLELTSKLLKLKSYIISFQTSSIDMEDVYYWILTRTQKDK